MPVGGSRIEFGVRNILNRAYPELIAGHIVAPGTPRAFVVTFRRG